MEVNNTACREERSCYLYVLYSPDVGLNTLMGMNPVNSARKHGQNDKL